MPTLVVDVQRTDWEQRAINDAALAADWHLVRVYGITDKTQGILNVLIDKDEDIFTYGSVEFTDEIDNLLKLGLDDISDDIMVYLNSDLVKRNMSDEFAGLLPKFWDDDQFPVFIKPTKKGLFEPKVFNSIDEFVKITKEIPYYSRLSVSDPVEFILEVRHFVLDGHVMTESPYMAYGQPLEIVNPKDTLMSAALDVFHTFKLYDLYESKAEFEKILMPALKIDAWELPRTYVMDLGYIKDKGWAVVEFNNTFSSGIYDCHTPSILECLKATKQTKLERLRDGGYLW